MSRYIDAERLKNALTEINAESDMPNDWHKGLNCAISYVEHTPTADVREVKRGKWIKHENNPRFADCLECPFCKCWFLHEHLVRNSFCPNCGADMRGEQE